MLGEDLLHPYPQPVDEQSHGHNHGHSHDHSHAKKADIWIEAATYIEMLSSFLSLTYWLATFFDVVTGFDDDIFNVSYYALGFGVSIALLSSAGATYCHRSMNISHQCKKHPHHSHGVSHETSNHSNFFQSPALTNSTSSAISSSNHSLIDAPTSGTLELINETTPLTTKDSSLTILQILALIGDFISHTGDTAGPLTFIVALATLGNMPRWGNAITQSIATLFAAIGTVANVRACKNNLEDMNAKKDEHSSPSFGV